MATTFYDRVKFATATIGAGAVLAGAPLSGYRTPVQAGIPDGATVPLLITMGGGGWEISTGVWNQAAGTFARTLRSSSTGSLLALDGTGVVTVTLAALEASSWLTPVVNGPLTVNGVATLNSLTVSTNATVGGTLGVTGNLTVAPTAAAVASIYLTAPVAQAAGVYVAGNGVASGLAYILSQGTDGQAYCDNQANAALNFCTNAAVRMTISAAGNVSTTGALNVAGTVTAAQINLPQNGDCYFTAPGGASSRMIFQVNGTSALYVTAGGVTTNTLTVNGNVNVAGDVYAVRGAGPTGVIFLGNAGAYLYFDGATYNLNGSHTLNNGAGGITCGALGSNSGIGGWQGISMLTGAGQNGGPYGYGVGAYAPPGSWGASVSRVDATNQYLELWSYAGTTVGSVTTTGSVVSYNTTSDERLKDFHGPLSAEDAIAIIAADPSRRFTWNEHSGAPGQDAVGWGAQTSYAVSPDLAVPAFDDTAADDGNPTHLWGMDQAKRTPYLWAAIGAEGGLLDRIAALEKALGSAQAEIAALKAASA
jgi:hypothetical protein